MLCQGGGELDWPRKERIVERLRASPERVVEPLEPPFPKFGPQDALFEASAASESFQTGAMPCW